MTTLQLFNTKAQWMRKMQLSDHEPVISEDVLSWNIMMQGRYNKEKQRYNNGHELVETTEQYQQRLFKIAAELAKICTMNPHIQVICLQEAPIAKMDLQFFANCCLSHPSLKKFEKTLRDNNLSTSWGLMSLFNGDRYSYISKPTVINGLEDRIQKFTLINEMTGEKRSILNLHLPFDKAKRDPVSLVKNVVSLISPKPMGSSKEIMIAGDFNFLVTQFSALHQLGSIIAPLNNSTETHSEQGGFNTLENVDAIIHVRPKRVGG